MSFDLAACRHLYPFQSRWLDLDGLRLHYLDEGRGAPLVLLHGNPTWSFYYRELVRAFCDTYRLIVPDHIGCGLSDKPGDADYEYTLARRVADIEALLNRVGADHSLTLVGHDWGGMIAAACALRRLHAVRGLVFLNTAAFLLPPGVRLPWPLRLIRGVPVVPALAVRGLNAFALGATHLATAKGLPAEVRRAYRAPYDGWRNRIATLRFVQDIPLRPADRSYALARWVDQHLEQLRTLPVFIGWGARDFVFHERFLEEWRRRLPQAEIHRFPDAGHYVVEDARDELIPLLRDFLARTAAAPPTSRTPLSASRPAPVALRPAGTPRINIADRLAAAAQRFPDKWAVVAPAGRATGGPGSRARLTFAQLDALSGCYAHRLADMGVGRGMRTILMVPPGPNFLALTFALLRLGAVPVLVDPGMGRQKLVECLARVEAAAFVGTSMAHLLCALHRRAFRSVRICARVGRRGLWGGLRPGDLARRAAPPVPTAPTGPDDTAAILFTSGSTGPPKGAVYTHAIIDAQVRSLESHFGYGPDEIDLATFPLFALFDTALGLTAVIPDMDASRPGAADPRTIISALQDQGCTHMFASPALLDRVGRYGAAHGVRLPALRRVVTAGAPVRPEILERFARLLSDGASIHTPYGATEALPIASITSAEILSQTRHATARGAGTCVGRPLGGVEVRIIELSDDPIADWSGARVLPTGRIGEIVVRGPVVTREYFRQPEATALAKITDGATVWHRMGDVGYLDALGRLWFCGRKSQRVVTERGTLFTIPCEAIFNQHPCVRRTALVGVGERGRQRPVLCVELEPEARHLDRHGLTQELLELGAGSALTRDIRTVLYHPAFPVDVRHNAKIFRERLAAWAAERLR